MEDGEDAYTYQSHSSKVAVGAEIGDNCLNLVFWVPKPPLRAWFQLIMVPGDNETDLTTGVSSGDYISS